MLSSCVCPYIADRAEEAAAPYCADLPPRYTIGTVLFNHGPIRQERGCKAGYSSVALPAVLRPARTRFAPSPTGDLHLGHAYSALTAWRAAGHSDKLFCLRIDDLDHTRCRAVYTEKMIDDLQWLGISWTETPLVSLPV